MIFLTQGLTNILWQEMSKNVKFDNLDQKNLEKPRICKTLKKPGNTIFRSIRILDYLYNLSNE